jgi:ribosomal protein S18 acetylase RimI-like enzyme
MAIPSAASPPVVLPTVRGRVRRALHSDDAAILDLEAHFPSDRISLRAVRRFLTSPSAHIWVAELGGKVVGNIILLTRRNSEVARIYSLVVAPEARGRRFAQRLVRTAESHGRELGVRAIKLEVMKRNKPARALYAKLGYTESEELPGYYENGAHGLRLRKILQS